MSKGLLADMFKYLPAQIVPGIVGLVSMPVVTRLFPPGVYGNYCLATATVVVLTTLFGWLPTSVIRYYPAYRKQGRLDVFHSTVLNLAGIALVVLATLYGATLFALRSRMPARLWHLLMIGGLLFAVTCTFNLLQWFLRSKRLVGRYSAFAVWQSAAGFGLGMVLIFLLGFGIEGLLFGGILSIMLVLPLQWKEVAGVDTRARFGRIDPHAAKAMLTYGTPLVAGNLAAWVLALSDRYILGLFHDSVDVGVYSLSYNIADRSLMLLTALFTMASGPIAMHIWENRGEHDSRQFATEVARLYLLACVPAVVGLSVLSLLVVRTLSGAAYVGGHTIMPCILLGVLLLGIQQLYQSGLLFHQKTSFITLAIVTAGVLNVFLNVLFVPRYGYYAAAATTLVSYAALLLLMIWLSRRFFVWSFPGRSLLNVVIASGVMGIVLRYVATVLGLPPAPLLVLCIGVGVVVYSVVLLVLGEFSSQELLTFRQAVRKVFTMMQGMTRPADGR